MKNKNLFIILALIFLVIFMLFIKFNRIDKQQQIICGNSVYDPGETINNCPEDIKNNPADLFDKEEILDELNFKTKILSSKSQNTELGKLKIIKAKYFSTRWRGIDIFNTVSVYIPDIPIENKGKAAIVLQGGSLATDPEIRFQEDFGARTALLLKIPVLVFNDGIPAEKYGANSESDLAKSFRKIMMEDNDFTREIIYPLSKILMRSMTFMSSLDEAGNPTEFVATGSSKRGVTQWVVSAVDSRIKGFMSNAYSSVNLINYWNLVEENWGGSSNLGNAQETLVWLNTDSGKQYQEYYDLYRHKELINVPFMINMGTNDNLFPIGATNGFFYDFDNPKSFELIENYPHGMGSKKHLANWRVIIQRTFFGRKTPSIDMQIIRQNNDEVKIIGTIKNNEKIKSVKVYYSKNEDMDFRDSIWQSKDMENKGNNSYELTLKMLEGNYMAYYIELVDEATELLSYSSSIVEIIDFDN